MKNLLKLVLLALTLFAASAPVAHADGTSGSGGLCSKGC
jgi:hypothetical protein